MDDCMQMNGGGPFGLFPGQVTDDSEMAMCLMWGLIQSNYPQPQKESQQEEAEMEFDNNDTDVGEDFSRETLPNTDGKKFLDTDKIARAYMMWVKSRPVDIGNATATALYQLESQGPKAVVAKKAAKMFNLASQSNGSMMRCTPMAVWSAGFEKGDDIYRAMKADAEFVHTNRLVHVAIF